MSREAGHDREEKPGKWPDTIAVFLSGALMGGFALAVWCTETTHSTTDEIMVAALLAVSAASVALSVYDAVAIIRYRRAHPELKKREAEERSARLGRKMTRAQARQMERDGRRLREIIFGVAALALGAGAIVCWGAAHDLAALLLLVAAAASGVFALVKRREVPEELVQDDAEQRETEEQE